MTDAARRERTAGLLIARLDLLARTTSHLPQARAARLVELAAVATSHAVALRLLEAERAAAIWRDAHARYPHLPQVALELPPASGRLAA